MLRLMNALNELMKQGIADEAFPGAVCAIVKPNQVILREAWGLADPESKTPAAIDTIYDIASLTKPITVTAVGLLIERGKLCLDQMVTYWLPEAEHLAAVTLRQLITHTSGLPSWKDYFQVGRNKKAILEAVYATPLEAMPGQRYCYSDVGYILLGAIIETVVRQPLNDFLRQNLFEPLGMNDTSYLPNQSLKSRFAVTGHCVTRLNQTLKGEVHDANTATMGGVAGHAGLFSAINDLIIFAQTILNEGQFEGKRILSPATLCEMATNQNAPNIEAHTFGWFAYPNGYHPRADLLSRQSFGHTGFTGTVMVFDPAIKSALILLTNRIYSDPEAARFPLYRKRILNIMAAIASEM
ncbi:MAG: serine hydrolase [bacterium]